MPLTVDFTLNGRPARASADARATLAGVLRETFGLTGCRETCGIGVCGTCTVLLDGRAVSACILPAFAVEGRAVETVEGLADGDGLHRVQRCFVQEQAFQCSFCTPGWIMSVVAMARDAAESGGVDVEDYLSGHLCRCGSYREIVAAAHCALARSLTR